MQLWCEQVRTQREDEADGMCEMSMSYGCGTLPIAQQTDEAVGAVFDTFEQTFKGKCRVSRDDAITAEDHTRGISMLSEVREMQATSTATTPSTIILLFMLQQNQLNITTQSHLN